MWIIQTYSLFKSRSVVQIWTIIYVEYFVNIDQKIGQKIQVKVFHRHFRKFSEQVHDGKLRTVAPDIMYVKPFIRVVGK